MINCNSHVDRSEKNFCGTINCRQQLEKKWGSLQIYGKRLQRRQICILNFNAKLKQRNWVSLLLVTTTEIRSSWVVPKCFKGIFFAFMMSETFLCSKPRGIFNPPTLLLPAASYSSGTSDDKGRKWKMNVSREQINIGNLLLPKKCH